MFDTMLVSLRVLFCCAFIGCCLASTVGLEGVRHSRSKHQRHQHDLQARPGGPDRNSHRRHSRPLFSWDLTQARSQEADNGSPPTPLHNGTAGSVATRPKRRRVTPDARRGSVDRQTVGGDAKKFKLEDVNKHKRSKNEHRNREKKARRKLRKDKENKKRKGKDRKKSKERQGKRKSVNNSLDAFDKDVSLLKHENNKLNGSKKIDIVDSHANKMKGIHLTTQKEESETITTTEAVTRLTQTPLKNQASSKTQNHGKKHKKKPHRPKGNTRKTAVVTNQPQDRSNNSDILTNRPQNHDFKLNNTSQVHKYKPETVTNRPLDVPEVPTSIPHTHVFKAEEATNRAHEHVNKPESATNRTRDQSNNPEEVTRKPRKQSNKPEYTTTNPRDHVRTPEVLSRIPHNYQELLALRNRKLAASRGHEHTNKIPLVADRDTGGDEDNRVPVLPGRGDVTEEEEDEDNLVPVFPGRGDKAGKHACAAANKRGGCEQLCREAGGEAVCSCYRGFRRHGNKCHDVNECAVSNGGCERGCRNTLGSYHCTCPPGFRLNDNDKTCRDVDECTLRNGHGPCQDTCTNVHAGYRCSCEGLPGTRLAANNHTCEDLDECSKNNAGCSHGCLNTLGNAFCLCPEGFRLGEDWKTCHDIDECRIEDPEDEICPERCINTPGSYHCARHIVCSPGFELGLEDCEDIDECNGNHSCSQLCVNTNGSYHCACEEGFSLQDKTKCIKICPPGFELGLEDCEDIDECSGDHSCSQLCVNTNGSYHCACEEGFTLQGVKCVKICAPGFELGLEDCEDVDECNGDHSCSQICINTNGSYYCDCEEGFSLQDTTKCLKICPPGFELGLEDCEDINECNGNHSCSQLCINNNGSYHCGCEEGFSLHDTTKCLKICPPGFELGLEDCEDINECNGNHSCSQLCVNTNGSYHCSCEEGFKLEDNSECLKICPPGFELGVEDCEDINECNGNHSCSQFCVNTNGSYHCACEPGYALQGNTSCVKICPAGFELGPHECDDVNECKRENICSHSCINTYGSYHCTCKVGYILNSDRKTCSAVILNAVCPPLDTPVHGYLECSRLSLRSGPWRYRVVNHSGSYCELRCPKGYRLAGVYRRFCGQHGRWLGLNYGACLRY